MKFCRNFLQVGTNWLTESDFWYKVILCTAMASFGAKSAVTWWVHTQCSTCPPCPVLSNSFSQFLIRSTFVLVFKFDALGCIWNIVRCVASRHISDRLTTLVIVKINIVGSVDWSEAVRHWWSFCYALSVCLSITIKISSNLVHWDMVIVC